MTKKELNEVVETLVCDLAVEHEAKIVDKKIQVGGKDQVTRVAEGGMFDFDACRGILAKRFNEMRAELTRNISAATADA